MEPGRDDKRTTKEGMKQAGLSCTGARTPPEYGVQAGRAIQRTRIWLTREVLNMLS